MRTKTKVKVFLSILVIIFAFIFSIIIYGESNGEITQLFSKATKLIPIYLVYIFTIVLRDQNITRFSEKITSGVFVYDKKKRKKLLSVIESYYDKMYLVAVDDLEKLEKECRTNHELSVILTIKGMCLYGKKITKDKAVAVLEQAVKYDDSNSYAWANLGYVYFQMGYLEKAHDYFAKAVAIDGNNAFAHSNLAFSYLYNKELDAALEHAYIALEYENKRDDAIAIMALGRAFQGDTIESKWYCKRYNGPRKARKILRNWIRDIDIRRIDIEHAHQLANWSSVMLGVFREPF